MYNRVHSVNIGILSSVYRSGVKTEHRAKTLSLLSCVFKLITDALSLKGNAFSAKPKAEKPCHGPSIICCLMIDDLVLLFS
jgi:hypothetical protein